MVALIHLEKWQTISLRFSYSNIIIKQHYKSSDRSVCCHRRTVKLLRVPDMAVGVFLGVLYSTQSEDLVVVSKGTFRDCLTSHFGTFTDGISSFRNLLEANQVQASAETIQPIKIEMSPQSAFSVR